MKDNHFRLRNKKGPTCRIDDRTDGGTEGRLSRGARREGGMNNELGVSHELDDGVASSLCWVKPNTRCTCSAGSLRSCFLINTKQ